MSFVAKTLFTAICDWPKCEEDVMRHSDYSGVDLMWLDEILADSDWWISAKPDSDGNSMHYCRQHPAAWASDINELGDAPPEGMYLLIHDGDTEDSDDDGKVTLIGGPVPEIDLSYP